MNFLADIKREIKESKTHSPVRGGFSRVSDIPSELNNLIRLRNGSLKDEERIIYTERIY